MLVKHNNNSISSITTPGQLAQGKMTLISEQTASGSASISFTSGIDSTYPIYRFEFINIHPSTGSAFTFQGSTNTGSSYGVTITSTSFRAYHYENDSGTALEYRTGNDLAQSTSFQKLGHYIGNDNDQSSSGYLHLFAPSSTTYVKHFIAVSHNSHAGDYSFPNFMAGYFNTTSAVNAIRFQMSSGNIDDGIIKMYGVVKS